MPLALAARFHFSTCASAAPHAPRLQVPRGAPHLLLTCGYDGSIRALDFNRGVSWELSHEEGGRDSGVSAMDICDVAPALPSAGGAGAGAGAGAAGGSVGVGISGTVIVGMYDGRVGLLDVRTPTHKRSMAHAFTAHNRKVTAASACGSAYFLTSSSDSTVKLWDARKIAEGSGRKGGTRAPVAETGSSQAVTSAFFSPQGTRVIATCNDNKLRLWVVDWASESGCCSLMPDYLCDTPPCMVSPRRRRHPSSMAFLHVSSCPSLQPRPSRPLMPFTTTTTLAAGCPPSAPYLTRRTRTSSSAETWTARWRCSLLCPASAWRRCPAII